MHDVSESIGTIAFHLTRAGYFLATAESCTGGMIASRCTDIAGSSAWFKGGIVSYANEIKRDLLSVPQRILDECGAVSAPVVETMALGALRACGAQASVAVSGIAGPGGGTAEKPVGTVWIAAAILEEQHVCIFGPESEAFSRYGCRRIPSDASSAVIASVRHAFTGNRDEVRSAATSAALAMLADLLKESISG